jgi:hypothetical protein
LRQRAGDHRRRRLPRRAGGSAQGHHRRRAQGMPGREAGRGPPPHRQGGGLHRGPRQVVARHRPRRCAGVRAREDGR